MLLLSFCAPLSSENSHLLQGFNTVSLFSSPIQMPFVNMIAEKAIKVINSKAGRQNHLDSLP